MWVSFIILIFTAIEWKESENNHIDIILHYFVKLRMVCILVLFVFFLVFLGCLLDNCLNSNKIYKM